MFIAQGKNTIKHLQFALTNILEHTKYVRLMHCQLFFVISYK